MSRKLNNFEMFLEGLRARNMSSLPQGYLSDVTARARERMQLAGQGVHDAVGPLMTELGRSQQLSRGHEEELEQLATRVITSLYKPIIDIYNIRLDIKFSSGGEIRRMIDTGYARKKGNDPSEIEKKTPVVKARGVDFSMLIHEAVKGIWRVLSMVSVPNDKELAKAIESQFNLMDEPDDWKYGPEIAADLRDFINENPKVYEYDNVREELWVFMTDTRKISDDDFLNLMKGILSKTPEARSKVDGYIEIIIRKIKDRDEHLRKMEEYRIQHAAWKKRQEEKAKRQSLPPITQKDVSSQEPESVDYSTMTQRELNDELSIALDARDYEKAKLISKYIK